MIVSVRSDIPRKGMVLRVCPKKAFMLEVRMSEGLLSFNLVDPQEPINWLIEHRGTKTEDSMSP